MKYREHAPAPALRAHVACYWSLEAADSSGHRVLPDGCMDLLFDVSGRGGGSLVGAMTTAVVTPAAARVTLFGVRFFPGEAFAFTEVRAPEVRLLGRIAWCPDDDEARPWAAIASELGFADQAHLAREVKALSGLTPTALARAGMRPAWT